MKDNKMADYWRANSPRWEAGAYFEEDMSVKKGLLESLSHYIRGRSVYIRMEFASDLLKPHIQNKKVLDIGCASGRFAKMLVNNGANHVTGIDISDAIIDIAQTSIENDASKDKITFLTADIREKSTQPITVDVVTALGVIEYLSPEEVHCLFENLSATYFLFHVADKPSTFKIKLRHFIRKGYLKLKGCPNIHFYNLEQFSDIAQQYGYKNIRKVGHFITNLPQ